MQKKSGFATAQSLSFHCIKLFDDKTCFIFAKVYYEQKPVGWASISKDKSEILNLWLSQTKRRIGIGTYVLNYLEKQLIANESMINCPRGVMSFYLKNGYKGDILPAISGSNFNFAKMRKVLL